MQSYIKCPKCLKKNPTDELERNTEYSCWSGEQTQVNCIHCEFYFEVACEHRGYEPTYGNFDLRAFKKIHNVKIPEEISVIFVDHYLRDYVDGETPKVVNEKDPKYQKRWEDAFTVANSEWNRIQESMKGADREDLV
jgi:hypothetical protein